MNINQRQKTILTTCAAVIGLMLMFPPFATYLPNGAQSGNGYAFIFAPPVTSWAVSPSVNAMQLLAQWVAVCLMGGVAYVLAGVDQSASTAMPSEKTSPPINGAITIGIPVLRIARGFVGFWGIVIVSGLVNDSLQLLGPESSQIADSGGLWAILLMKTVGALMFILAFILMRKFINFLQTLKTGSPEKLLPKQRNL